MLSDNLRRMLAQETDARVQAERYKAAAKEADDSRHAHDVMKILSQLQLGNLERWLHDHHPLVLQEFRKHDAKHAKGR